VIVHICHGKGNMKKQMKSADKLGCQFAVILGETEVEKEFVKVKNFQTRQEEKVTLNYLLSHPFTTSP
jgi:histidyl-tRNA synthetase